VSLLNKEDSHFLLLLSFFLVVVDMETPASVLADMTRAATAAGISSFTPYMVTEIDKVMDSPACLLELVDGRTITVPSWSGRERAIAWQRCGLLDKQQLRELIQPEWRLSKDVVNNFRSERMVWLTTELVKTQQRVVQLERKYRELKNNVHDMVRSAKAQARHGEREEIVQHRAYDK